MSSDKEKVKAKEEQLLEMTGAFCEEKLDADYARLCEKLVKKMGRNRDVPFKRGQLDIWASAVIHALGSINFLFDKSFEPYVPTDEICEYFSTKKTTVSSKAKVIKDMFGLRYFDPEFSTQAMAEENPFNNLVMVDGLIVSLDSLPEELQKEVRDARARGEDIEFETRDGF